MEEEELRRMEFINENIIEKGLDLEDFSNFVNKNTGKDFNSLSLSDLENMLNLYNNKENDSEQKEEEDKKKEKEQENKEIINKIKEKSNEKEKEVSNKKEEELNKKEKESNQDKKDLSINAINKGIYYPESFEFKTDIQQKNKLLELSQNNNLISVIVSEPKLGQKGYFFFKNEYSYRVQCPQINSDVRRTYSDFEWFRNQLIIRYPLRLVPPIMKENIFKQIGNIFKFENEDIIEQTKTRYLNKFINSLLQKKIFRTSPIFHEFLSLNEDNFKKYQNQISSKKYELSIQLNNLITMNGKIKCSFSSDSIVEANKMENKFTSLSNIYKKIDTTISIIINDFNNLSLHFNEMTENFNNLIENLNQNNYNNIDDMKNNFKECKDKFNKWSVLFGNQRDCFIKDFKENIDYMSIEIDEMNLIFKKYNEYKNEYENFSSMINKKKENLFNTKNYEKWEIHPDKQKDFETFKSNKELAFGNMLYKENRLLKEEKKRIAVTIFKMNKQYDKLMEMHKVKVQQIFDSIKSITINFGNENN